jgi:methylmalonyl-CoA mutase N-terminal domain/subunit
MLDGVYRGIEEGWFQSAIGDSAYEFEKAVSSGERVVVGVNRFVTDDEAPFDTLRIGPEVEERHRVRLGDLRGRRDASRVGAALDAVREGAAGDTNLMPVLVEAARAGATLGETVEALKSVFGGYREPPRV